MTKQEVINMIEHDNKRQMLYRSVMPHILDILHKYNGKQYGERTREKMREELKEKCNCSFYLSNGYGADISIAPLDKNGFSGTNWSYSDFDIYVKYPTRGELRPLSDTNTICGNFAFEDFKLSNCHEQVNDVEAHADNILYSFKYKDY